MSESFLEKIVAMLRKLVSLCYCLILKSVFVGVFVVGWCVSEYFERVQELRKQDIV